MRRALVGLCLVIAVTPAFADPSSKRAAIPGKYTSSAQHPRVFLSQDDVDAMARQVEVANSFVAKSFKKLTGHVAASVSAKVDWDAAYSGCDLDTYLHAFSFESSNGYAGQTRTADQMRTALNIKSELAAPAGAAVVAARLSLYAALVHAGARPPAGSPSAHDASALARRILLAWANHGFRDAKGHFLNKAEQFCDGQGKFIRYEQNGVGLQVARGVIYSVDAQDLLQSLGELDAAQTRALDAFHAAMFDLIHEASVFRFALPELNHPDTVCELYSNHVGTHLLGLLAIARLEDDRRKFEAVLYGGDASIAPAIPWTTYFDHAVYGEGDTPVACYKNTGADGLTSHPSFQTAVVAPGEIDDRYRNANPEQAFGYSVGVVRALFEGAEILKTAGLDAYAYRGSHKQSIEMATQYFACYAKAVGFKKTVTADNARGCADNAQYVGKLVNDVENIVLLGSYRFPTNQAITELEATARDEVLRDAPDPLHFGRWRN